MSELCPVVGELGLYDDNNVDIKVQVQMLTMAFFICTKIMSKNPCVDGGRMMKIIFSVFLNITHVGPVSQVFY